MLGAEINRSCAKTVHSTVTLAAVQTDVNTVYETSKLTQSKSS